MRNIDELVPAHEVYRSQFQHSLPERNAKVGPYNVRLQGQSQCERSLRTLGSRSTTSASEYLSERKTRLGLDKLTCNCDIKKRMSTIASCCLEADSQEARILASWNWSISDSTPDL